MRENLASLRPLSALVLVLSSTGCVGRFERPNSPAVIVVPAPQGVGNYTLANYQSDLTAYANASAGDPGSADVLRVRNRMIYGIMAEIDYVFFDYESKLFLNQGKFHVASDFLQLGLASAATLTNGGRGKTILAALLSGATGTSLSADKNFFREQTVQAITSSMEANRDRIKTVILQQLTQNITTYPFEAARTDLIRYFFAGTLQSGLQQVHQQAATNAQEQKVQMNRAQTNTR